MDLCKQTFHPGLVLSRGLELRSGHFPTISIERDHEENVVVFLEPRPGSHTT
jgi:hypothetical protein